MISLALRLFLLEGMRSVVTLIETQSAGVFVLMYQFSLLQENSILLIFLPLFRCLVDDYEF
jgi:hypothetical protein